MNTWARMIQVMTLAALVAGCLNDEDYTGRSGLQPPAEPQMAVAGDTKQLIFSWAAVNGASHYRLMENPDGHSGFTQLGNNIPASTLMRYAGWMDDELVESSDTETAVRNDPDLTDAQKSAMLEIYRGFTGDREDGDR